MKDIYFIKALDMTTLLLKKLRGNKRTLDFFKGIGDDDTTTFETSGHMEAFHFKKALDMTTLLLKKLQGSKGTLDFLKDIGGDDTTT